MTGLDPSRDAAERAFEAAAAALTLGAIALAIINPPAPPPPAMAAPKPTEATLAVVEEAPPPPPPPPPAPAPPPPEPAPPPQLAPSPLPPPPPPRPHRIQHPQRPPPPRAVEAPETPAAPVPPTPEFARSAQQAPENHSAEAIYIGRLHALVARNTVAPAGAAYRLSHPHGEVLIGFALTRGGAPSAVHVLRSSGSSLLDNQGLSIVAALRYPAMPDDVYPGQAAHVFSVPLNFPDTGNDEE